MTKINWQDIPDHPTWLNPNPTRDELETLIASIPKTITIPAKQEPWQRDKTEALRRKIVALTKALELKLAALNPPRTIVSTMTREQLFLLKIPTGRTDYPQNKSKIHFFSFEVLPCKKKM